MQSSGLLLFSESQIFRHIGHHHHQHSQKTDAYGIDFPKKHFGDEDRQDKSQNSPKDEGLYPIHRCSFQKDIVDLITGCVRRGQHSGSFVVIPKAIDFEN